MSLPAADITYLSSLGLEHRIEAEAGMTCVVLRRWSLPAGFNYPAADVLVRLPQGYPDTAPDMWWFSPPIKTASGVALPNTDVFQDFLGRQWQRWSRHLTPGQWQSGIDGLESYFTLIRSELRRAVLATVG